MSIKIEKLNNRLVINKDNTIIFPYAYMTYIDENNDYANFINAGFSLFSISIMCGEHGVNEYSQIPALSEGLYINKDGINFKPLDESINRIISLDKDAYIIVRLNLNVPDWWRKENPEELIELSDGKKYMESPCSEKWIKFAKDYISSVYEHIIASSYRENIIALHLGAIQTEEWIAMRTASGSLNYSPCFKKYYFKYLKEKYKSINDLNLLYKTSYGDFNEVLIPNMDIYPSKKDLVPFEHDLILPQIDYLEAFNSATADAIIDLLSFTKSLVNKTMLVGVFYGYIAQIHGMYGHSAFEKVLDCGVVDFLAFPPAYTNSRQGANDFFYHSAIDSLRSRNVLVFVENDFRTYKSKFVFEVYKKASYSDFTKQMLSVPTWMGPKTLDESLSVLNRAFSKTLISNEAFWWFDMWGDFYNDKPMQDFMAKSLKLIKESNVTPNNEFAIILDQAGSFETNEYMFYYLSYQFIWNLGFVGASYDIYSIKDVDKIKDKYKCLIYILPSYKTREKYSSMGGVGNYIIGSKDYYFNKETSYQDIATALKENGVHLYSEGNIIYQSKEFICVTAKEDGLVNLSFDNQTNLINAFDSKEKYEGKQISVDLSSNETRLFIIKNKN